MKQSYVKFFEESFCIKCKHYGEPNGCNRAEGQCYAYDFCADALEKLDAYEQTGFSPERCAELAEAEADGRLSISQAN